MSILGKKSNTPANMELFKKTDQLEKKSAPLNVSFDANERAQLKTWAKAYKTTMAKIIKRALGEFYLRHEMERVELEQFRKNQKNIQK